MVQVRLLVPIANRRGSWRAGELYDCEPAEAKRLISAGVGEAVKAKARKATKATGSKATARE